MGPFIALALSGRFRQTVATCCSILSSRVVKLGVIVENTLGVLNKGAILPARYELGSSQFRDRLNPAVTATQVDEADDFLVILQTQCGHHVAIKSRVTGAPDTGVTAG